MRRLSIQFKGPLARSVEQRTRRRLRETSSAALVTVAAAGTFYVAAAYEPSLSGEWYWEDTREEARVFHTGRQLTAYNEGGGLVFRASLTPEGDFAGFVNLWWPAHMEQACGGRYWGTQDDFVASVDAEGNRIETRYTREFADEQTCEFIRSQLHHVALRRRSE